MRYKYFFIFFLFSICACSDFLEQEPESELLESEVFSDINILESLLNAAYRPLGYEYVGDLTGQDTYCLPFIYADGRSDDILIENYFFGGSKFHDFETLTDLTPSNTQVRAVWFKYFNGLAKTNDLISGLASVNDDVLSTELKEQFVAESRFLRAMYYFELVRNFGDVPLFDGIIDATIEDNLRRKPTSEVYAFMEQDLIFAADILPVSQTDTKKATKGAAYAQLAKTYLYQSKWQDAANAAQEVIDLGVYQLEENFEDNFKLWNENGIESIFEIHYDESKAWVFDSRQTSSLAAQLSTPSLAAPLGGWNYNLPTPELINAFMNEGDIIRREASIILGGDSLRSELLAAEGLDPLPVDYSEREAQINDPDGGTLYGLGYGYSKKFFLTAEEVTETTGSIQHSPLNQKVLRYGEVLLILAEAVANGASGDGQGAFDQIRERAGLDSKPLSIENIKLERRLELVNESNRFYDLVRWGDADAEIEQFTAGRDELLPIPAIEIELTGQDEAGADLLSQNPGY